MLRKYVISAHTYQWENGLDIYDEGYWRLVSKDAVTAIYQQKDGGKFVVEFYLTIDNDALFEEERLSGPEEFDDEFSIFSRAYELLTKHLDPVVFIPEELSGFRTRVEITAYLKTHSEEGV